MLPNMMITERITFGRMVDPKQTTSGEFVKSEDDTKIFHTEAARYFNQFSASIYTVDTYRPSCFEYIREKERHVPYPLLGSCCRWFN